MEKIQLIKLPRGKHMLGRKLPKEWCDNISRSLKGRNIEGHPQSIETRAKISASMKGIPKSLQTRANMSKAQKGLKKNMGPEWQQKIINANKARGGNKHWNWQGGIADKTASARRNIEYKDWRLAVFVRDGFTCQECGSVGKNLQADHIKSFAHFPELRYEISNGRTLCKECHFKTPTYGGRSIRRKRLGENTFEAINTPSLDPDTEAV